MPEEKTGAPRRSSAVAGAGTGRTPWAHWTVPLPVLSAEQYQRVGGDGSTATAAQTMSTMASSEPTSWKWMDSGGAIVNLGLGLGEELKSLEREVLGGGADGSAGDDLADFGRPR